MNLIDLPDGYDPNDDGGKQAVEMFLDWEVPPASIVIDVRDGKYFALVEGGVEASSFLGGIRTACGGCRNCLWKSPNPGVCDGTGVIYR